MMNFAAVYDCGAFEALERVEDRKIFDDRNRSFYDDVMEAERETGRELASGLFAFLTDRQRGLARLRKSCLFADEEFEIWSAIRAAAKAFDDAFC